MKNKIISLLFILSTVLSCFSMTANAEETYQEGDWIYSQETNKIVGWAGEGDSIVIPENSVVSAKCRFKNYGLFSEKLQDYVMVRNIVISKGAVLEDGFIRTYAGAEKIEFFNNVSQMPEKSLYFSNFTNLKTLRLPEGLTKIPDNMCYCCDMLENIYIPDSVIEVGNKAFTGCFNLKSLPDMDNIVTIGDGAFANCKGLESFVAKNLKNLGENVFENVSLKEVYIPAGIDYKKIRSTAALEKVTFEKEPEYDGELCRYFWGSKWLENEVFSKVKEDFFIDSKGCLIKYFGKGKDPVIPGNVKKIGNHAFQKSDITSVTIPEGVTEIGALAFENCNQLKEAIIPESVKRIGWGAFSWCEKLEKVVVAGPAYIEGEAFMGNLILNKGNIFLNEGVRYEGVEEDIQYVSVEPYRDPLLFLYPGYKEPTLSPTPTQKPDSTVSPTQSAKPTTAPTAAPTTAPTATSTPEEKHIDVSSKGGDVELVINSETVHFPDAKPFIDESDRTQIPIRVLSELLGFEVKWEEESHTAVLTRENTVITVKIGDKHITKNGTPIEMDTEAKIIGDRTYIPLRFIAEALGCTVEWK